MAIYQYGEHQPDIHDDVYVAETADVIGQVTLKARSSVWYQAVLRGAIPITWKLVKRAILETTRCYMPIPVFLSRSAKASQ